MKIGICWATPRMRERTGIYSTMYQVENMDTGHFMFVRLSDNKKPLSWRYCTDIKTLSDTVLPTLSELSEEEYFQLSLVCHLDLDTIQEMQDFFIVTRPTVRLPLGTMKTWEY